MFSSLTPLEDSFVHVPAHSFPWGHIALLGSLFLHTKLPQGSASMQEAGLGKTVGEN